MILKKPSFLRRAASAFTKPSTRWGVGFLVVTGFVAGLLFSSSLVSVMDATNTEKFCTSCHEMDAFVYEE